MSVVWCLLPSQSLMFYYVHFRAWMLYRPSIPQQDCQRISLKRNFPPSLLPVVFYRSCGLSAFYQYIFILVSWRLCRSALRYLVFLSNYWQFPILVHVLIVSRSFIRKAGQWQQAVTGPYIDAGGCTPPKVSSLYGPGIGHIYAGHNISTLPTTYPLLSMPLATYLYKLTSWPAVSFCL
jgi:hypothetical protein